MKLKTLIILLSALMFNAVTCGAISVAAGLPLASVLGGGTVLSLFAGKSGGVNMAIQREIWMNTIVEGLFADNSFLSKAVNADGFVNMGRTVHIPNAGNPGNVVKNRTNLPADVSVRTDVDLTFNLDEYTTDPIRIPHADTVELSYDKRNSVLRGERSNLQEKVSEAILFSWAPSTAGNIIKTTGGSVAAHTPSATGNRLAFTKEDVNTAMLQFNLQNIPQEGRYLLLDANMYSELLNSLTQLEAQAFFSQANVAAGTVGKLYSFDIMMRSKVLVYATAGTPKEWTAAGAATDNAAALAWHHNSVCRALGEVVAYENEKDPTWYGDIYSFLVRCGGRPMRNDVAGLFAIVQDVYVAPQG
jgi:hypothetical protein